MRVNHARPKSKRATLRQPSDTDDSLSVRLGTTYCTTSRTVQTGINPVGNIGIVDIGAVLVLPYNLGKFRIYTANVGGPTLAAGSLGPETDYLIGVLIAPVTGLWQIALTSILNRIKGHAIGSRA